MDQELDNTINELQLNDISDNLIIIPISIINKIIQSESKNKSDAISLYVFYYYTAKWQKTNQPKAIDRYSKLCLKIGTVKLKEAQKLLLDLGLIQRIIKKDSEGKIKGWYIKINYIVKKQTVNKYIWESEEIRSSQTPISVYYEFELLKSKGIHKEIFKKQNYICQYCDSKVIELNTIFKKDLKTTWKYINKNNIKIATIDHIIPLSKGGNNENDNLTTSCHICNSIKNNNQLVENEVVDSSTSGKQETNALSANNINALSANKKKESKNDSSTLELEIYKKIIDGFYQYHNKQYDFTSKERGIAKDISKKLSKYENWYDILKNKVECLNKKVKENPKFWAFTISKLQYGWNEFTDTSNSLSNQTEEIINHLQEKKNATK